MIRKDFIIDRFDYILYEVPDRAYGIREASGKWNGMVGELQSGVSST